MRERIRTVGLVVVVAFLAPGASMSRPLPRWLGGQALTVDVVGDSLITQAAPEVSARLAAGGFVVRLAHRPAQDLGSQFVQEQLVIVGDRPGGDVLVLSTAANDALRNHDRAVERGIEAAADFFDDLVDQLVNGFADRCVVVVNAREDTTALYHPGNARAVNDLLDEARGRHPNLVVVDWAAVSRLVPAEWFAPDQLHFGLDPTAPAHGSGSAREYAAAIVDGVRRCAPSGARGAERMARP